MTVGNVDLLRALKSKRFMYLYSPLSLKTCAVNIVVNGQYDATMKKKNRCYVQ